MSVKPFIDTVSILKSAIQHGTGRKYSRLAQAIEQAIQAGTIAFGTKLPPHRILATKLGITAGTVSRAYAELERLGLVIARVGDGTFVRQHGQQPTRESGFNNFSPVPARYHDMSRNRHISGNESELLAATLKELAQDSATLSGLLQYTPESGLLHHRQAGARWLTTGDFTPAAAQIHCVNGSQHGLHSVLMAVLRAGDTLVTEQLTYPGLISIARFSGIKVLGIAMDEEGLLPDSLDEICRTHRVAALYCTPTIQNPTTAILSVKRRMAIARICTRHNLLIIEDETHAVLLADRPPPVCLFAPERGIVISGLSKAVAAGLRVGYIYTPERLAGRQAAAIRNSCWMATPLTQEIATRWINQGFAWQLLQQQREEIMRRKAQAEPLLHGLNYRTHPCSPHFWLEVPAPGQETEIVRELRQQGQLIASAGDFSVGNAARPHFVRASVSNSSGQPGDLIGGFFALAQTLRGRADTESLE